MSHYRKWVITLCQHRMIKSNNELIMNIRYVQNHICLFMWSQTTLPCKNTLYWFHNFDNIHKKRTKKHLIKFWSFTSKKLRNHVIHKMSTYWIPHFRMASIYSESKIFTNTYWELKIIWQMKCDRNLNFNSSYYLS